MKNAIVLILLISGIVLLIMAVNTYQESTASLDVLGLELSANNESGQRSALMYFILGLAGLVGSYLAWKKK